MTTILVHMVKGVKLVVVCMDTVLSCFLSCLIGQSNIAVHFLSRIGGGGGGGAILFVCLFCCFCILQWRSGGLHQV